MVREKRKYKGKIKNYKVLIRLLLTISVFICIPMLLVNVLIVNADIKRMQAQKTETYQAYTDNFRNFFNHELDKMFACSIDLSVNKTITEKDVSGGNRYLWDTFAKVRNYRNGIPIAEDVFIFIHQTSHVLGSEYSYDSIYFARMFLDGEEEILVSLPESFDDGRGFRKASGQAGGMFAVYPASVRKTGDTSVFFHITTDILNDAFYDLSCSDAETYIFDMDGEILLSGKKKARAVEVQPELSDFVKNFSEDTVKTVADGEKWYLFKSYDEKNRLVFLTAVPGEEFLDSARNVRSYNSIFLLAEILLCAVMLACVVHLNYLPIRKLKRKYLDDRVWEAENEIEGIARLLEQTMADRQSLTSLVKERTTQLSDYVLRGMLNGEEIPDNQRRLLSLNEALDHMFVMAVQGMDVDSDIEGKVSGRLADGLERIVYAIVDSYENCLMFACMISGKEEPVRREMAENLKEILEKEMLNRNFRIGIGEYCSIREGLKTARITALIALEQCAYGKLMYYENALRDFRHVEFYPNRQMLTYIRYLKEGNEEQALLMLEQIVESIRINVQSSIMRKYICYDIVNEFIRLITLLDVKVEESKILMLMRFETLESLKSMLAELTAATCREVEEKKVSAEKELVREIMQFIYDNISDPDLSREIVADRFQISVNTVSLLCTNVIGYGFRELIVAHRVELARKLLKDTELSVNEVAVRVGFRDTSYFIKIFKKVTGKTPRIFKNEAEGERAV